MSNHHPLVSVVIPFYNCQYVAQAIESVLRQTYPHVELIVVNDGSNKFQDLISPYLSKITYIEQVNKGVAAALNHGIKKAKGEYLVWLSSDDIMDDHKIELQLNFMNSVNSFLSFTNFNIINENSQITSYNVGINFQKELEFLQALHEFCPINGCTVMMSRKVIETIGYFNEQLKYAQDYEYWLRVTLHFPIHYFHITLTNYRVHQLMGSILNNHDQMTEFYSIREKYREKISELISTKGNESHA
ncbi:glycosyltransferase [Peribacillus simplex]|uniref:Glycosyltransferase n=1 Tax=Peribacillus simplex TaxID=1478 RepID=A0A9X9EQI0_9BACI|nr:glycosyltransferase [Peribacillus simplex]TKH07766.1 glycosyltransferase [Peribacillus simplex]